MRKQCVAAAYTKEQVKELEAYSEAFAYTDGSAFMQDDRYAYAAIFLQENVYDYDVLGRILFSEANSTPLWNGYIRRIRQFSQKITIRFVKIKSHGFSGNNKRVDELAKEELKRENPEK